MRWTALIPLALAAQMALAGVQPALAADRAVTDDTGRSLAIPQDPKRIVVLHEPLLGLPLLDLGVEVTGSYGRSDGGQMLTAVDFIDTVLARPGPKPKGIGAVGQIDLEKLRKLDPDLIIGTERDADKTGQLSAIAPVYLQKASTGRTRGVGVEEDLARLLGRQEVFEARKKTYLDRVAALRATLPPGEGTYMAVIVHDQVNLVGEISGAIQALEDLGYRPAGAEGLGAGKGLGSIFATPLSPEIFGRADPDLLVIMNSYAERDRSPAAIRARLDKIMPGWDKFLKPAREGRILYLDSGEVATPTIASAEHTLDAFAAKGK